jgi:hypothetical protein
MVISLWSIWIEINKEKSKHINLVNFFLILVLSAVVITNDGEKVATASEKGIEVRIFDTKTGEMLQEVRRGN